VGKKGRTGGSQPPLNSDNAVRRERSDNDPGFFDVEPENVPEPSSIRPSSSRLASKGSVLRQCNPLLPTTLTETLT